MTPQIKLDPARLDQFRFPRSKGKRLRKKFARNPRNLRPSRILICQLSDRGVVFICHPTMRAAAERISVFQDEIDVTNLPQGVRIEVEWAL